jgi:hypothetical protein
VGGPVTPEHIAAHEAGAERAFINARESLHLSVPEAVTEGPLHDVALDIACSDVAGDLQFNVAVQARDDYWVAAIRAPSPWVAGEIEIAEDASYEATGVQAEDETLAAYSVAACDQVTSQGRVVTAIVLGYEVPDDAAMEAWKEEATAASAVDLDEAREAAGLEALPRTPELDAMADQYATQVGATFAEGGEDPSVPNTPPELAQNELIYDWSGPLRITTMGTPGSDLVAVTDRAQAVGYSAIFVGGATAIVRVVSATPG